MGETVVTNNQNIIDKLPKGEQCMQLGQASVLIAQTEKSKADALVVSTRTAVAKASNHKVEFGSRTYSSLTKGKCDTFFSHSNYVTAKATYKAAVTAHNKAVGAAAEATKILKIKISAAAKEKHECLCKTQKSHATEFSPGAPPTQPTRPHGTSPTRFSARSTARPPASLLGCPPSVVLASPLLPRTRSVPARSLKSGCESDHPRDTAC